MCTQAEISFAEERLLMGISEKYGVARSRLKWATGSPRREGHRIQAGRYYDREEEKGETGLKVSISGELVGLGVECDTCTGASCTALTAEVFLRTGDTGPILERIDIMFEAGDLHHTGHSDIIEGALLAA